MHNLSTQAGTFDFATAAALDAFGPHQYSFDPTTELGVGIRDDRPVYDFDEMISDSHIDEILREIANPSAKWLESIDDVDPDFDLD